MLLISTPIKFVRLAKMKYENKQTKEMIQRKSTHSLFTISYHKFELRSIYIGNASEIYHSILKNIQTQIEHKENCISLLLRFDFHKEMKKKNAIMPLLLRFHVISFHRRLRYCCRFCRRRRRCRCRSNTDTKWIILTKR